MMPLLDEATIEQRLGAVPTWRREGGAIVRDLELPDFATALGFVNAVGEEAERRDHHPDIDIRWRTVTFRCATHSAGGVTTRDIALANRIDRIVADAS